MAEMHRQGNVIINIIIIIHITNGDVAAILVSLFAVVSVVLTSLL